MIEEGVAKRKREIVEYASEGSGAIVRLAVGSRKLKADLDYHEGFWCSYVDVNDTLSELFSGEIPTSPCRSIVQDVQMLGC